MSGEILQIVKAAVGVIIYMPFVKMYDKSKMRSEAARMNELTNILKKAENLLAKILDYVPFPIRPFVQTKVSVFLENLM